MAQRAQVIDITKSYLPGDPNAYVQSLVNTDREDGEEKTLPVLPYEGINFLPTAYGQRSYFGTNSTLGIGALASRAQAVLLYQIPTYKSRLIALCEDGIWVATADGTCPNWVQVVTHTFDANIYEEWTWCVIENILYMYKQGTAQVYKTVIGTWTIVGAPVTAPSDYEAFEVLETLDGDGSFVSGDIFEISISYYQTTTGDYSGASEIYPLTTSIDSDLGFTVDATGVPPLSSDIEYIITIYEDNSGLTYIKQFPSLSVEPITTLADFVAQDVPSSAQGFALSDPAGGDGTFDTDIFLISVQYVKGPIQYGGSIEYIGDSTAAAGSSIRLTISGASPGVGTSLRIHLENDNTGDTYYKEVALGATINILSLTECTLIAGNDPQHLLLDDVVFSNDLTIGSFVPSFLNMAGQMGIFRAGTRLGFWDSANSVSWSSNLDLTDFTPSIENLAGNTIFGYVTGRIVVCKSHGEGFIIYSTKSIVGVTFAVTGNLLWDGKKVFDNSGIASSKSVTTGKTDAEHFVFGVNNIYTIGKFNALAGKYEGEAILPELYDFLKESRDPIALTILQDRYLCFSLVNSDYVYGRQSFSAGLANPYEVVVDWYIPSNDYPTATYNLLPEQMWEIIRDEMSGSSATKRKDGEWVPRYTSTVDIMDDRYYSFGREWIGDDITGKARYSTYSTYFDSLPVNLTAGDITTYLNPQRPISPPDAYRYGILRTATDMRAFWNIMGVDPRANNEALIYLQESEWEYFKTHQRANRDRLEAYSGEIIALGTPTTVTPTTGGTGLAVNWSFPGSNNGTWTVSIGAIVLASGNWSNTSTFSDDIASQSTSGSPSWCNATGSPPHANYGWQPGKLQIFSGSTQWSGLGPPWINSAWDVTQSSGSWSEINLTGASAANTDNTAAPINTVIGILVTGEGNNEWLTTEGPAEKAAKEIILRRTFNKGYEVTKHVVVRTEELYTSVASVVTKTIRTTTTTTYTTEEVTGTYGYSQFRALVTWWDRIRFGLYGNYEILESVAAEAMTAKIWEGTYPADKGTGRDQIWSYGQYKAQALTDLAAGTIGQIDFKAADADGTSQLVITGYDTEGITSAHSSYTLPGASFLLQTGSIEASYPTFTGAIVFDLSLKKWGKYKGDHKLLIETTPINSAPFGTITYSDLGANAGIFSSTGFVQMFDSAPLESWIRYGKIGFYRQGFSDLVEVRASMRNPSDFNIVTESSMDGKLLDLSKNTYSFYTDEVVAEAFIDISARWHTVKISGNYDLTGLEARATLSGRR